MSLTPLPLTRQFHDAVIRNDHLNSRRMHIRNDAGHVTIQGSVQSFYEKQMAQEALRGIDGVQSIENELEVTWA
jgi:osmotically-inducible protein OsmY